jgi:hypothetical protein
MIELAPFLPTPAAQAAALGPINQQQTQKLKQLSVMSLATKNKVRRLHHRSSNFMVSSTKDPGP